MRIQVPDERRYSFPVRLIFKALRRKYGKTLEPMKAWGLTPKPMFGLLIFNRALDRKSSPLEPALRSLVIVRVSQINHCAFCVDLNAAQLQARGGSLEKIAALPEFERSTLFAERERSALAYAEAMTRGGDGVSDAVFARLRAQFSDLEIVELTALIAFQNLSSRFNAALDIPAQGFCVRPPVPPTCPEMKEKKNSSRGVKALIAAGVAAAAAVSACCVLPALGVFLGAVLAAMGALFSYPFWSVYLLQGFCR